MVDAIVDQAAMRERLGARVSQRAAAFLAAASAAFAFFAGVTAIVRPPGATEILLAVDAGGALLMGAAALRARSRPPSAARANAVVGGALLLTQGASLLAIRLLHLPAQTTNLLILLLVASMILLSLRWVVALVAATLAGFALVATSEGWNEAWLNAAFALVATTIMAIMVQLVRLRDARRTEILVEANMQKALDLERAVARERAHARELATANDSLEAFTYVVSHDLKEPLRALRAYLEDLGDELSTPAAQEAYKRVAQSETQLERLVEGLLEWSRTGTAGLTLEPIDVTALLEEPTTRQLFDRLLEERRGKLLIERDLPPVHGSAALLRQTLGNIILNAVRHNTRPDPQVRVYAAPDAREGFVEIIVEDNGPGFPQAVIDRVEGLGDRPSTVKGGFGLAIARRAAERMGGALHLSNAPGGGARAHVVLPSRPPAASEEADAEESRNSPARRL